MNIIKEDITKMIKENRKSLVPDWQLWSMTKSDKKLKKDPPEVYKKYNGGKVIELIKEFEKEEKGLLELVNQRSSKRRYKEIPMTLKELSYLMFSVGKLHSEGNGWTKRVIPTAGATHNLETYVVITNVEEVDNGFYRYMPDTGNLEFIKDINIDDFNESIYKQVRSSGASVIWSSIPYRCEYKYTFAAHKMISMEAGHACQNLYLASEAQDLGCCAIGSYNQSSIDRLLGFDGENEFVIYLATVGHI